MAKMAKMAIKIPEANYAETAINFLFRKLHRQNNSEFYRF